LLIDKDPFLILDYIKSSVEIWMNLKTEGEGEGEENKEELSQHSDNSAVEPSKDYEVLLQKLEAEARSHIRVEQQLKLHIESMQSKLEESEKYKQEVKSLSQDLNKVKDEVRSKDLEIQKIKQENHRLNEELQASKVIAADRSNSPGRSGESGENTSKTMTNISIEEGLNTFHADIGQLKRTGELAERVICIHI